MSHPLITVLLVLTGLSISVSDQHVFGIGGKAILCVPEAEMDSLTLRYADKSTDLHPGAGRIPGFGFLFDAAFMGSHFEGYNIKREFQRHPYVNALSGSVSFVGAEDQHRWGPANRARDTEDEWYSQKKCPQPVVTILSGTSLYEVKCANNVNYASLWSRRPDSKMPMPNVHEFVVATCNYENIDIGPYAGNTLRTCSRIVVKDGFMFDYRFQKENAKFIEGIDAFLDKKLTEWKENCSSTRL